LFILNINARARRRIIWLKQDEKSRYYRSSMPADSNARWHRNLNGRAKNRRRTDGAMNIRG